MKTLTVSLSMNITSDWNLVTSRNRMYIRYMYCWWYWLRVDVEKKRQQKHWRYEKGKQLRRVNWAKTKQTIANKLPIVHHLLINAALENHLLEAGSYTRAIDQWLITQCCCNNTTWLYKMKYMMLHENQFQLGDKLCVYKPDRCCLKVKTNTCTVVNVLSPKNKDATYT